MKVAAATARRRSNSGRLNDEGKRLLAAILEYSLLLRPQPHHDHGSSQLGLDRAMKAHRLGPRHITALLSVALYGPLSVTQLAERHHMLVKTASLIAVELEAAGVLERSEDPADRRRTIVAIARGKERAIEQGLNRRAAPIRRTLDRLSPAERRGLIAGLEVLGEELSRARDEGGLE